MTTKHETETETQTTEPRRPRGFAALPKERVQAIASAGGRAAHAQGTAHRWTSEQARAAGKKGGVAPHVRRGRGPTPPALESEELDEPKGAA